MFTSILDRISNSIENYDRYGEFRINALIGIYVFFILAAVNMIYGIPNPYFGYFYLPLTALTAEMMGENLRSKYLLFFHATMGAIVAVLLFNLFSPYSSLFVFFVFFYSLLHYIIALHFIKSIFASIPIALSLAIYSISYPSALNTDFYVALNNTLISVCAMCIIMAALLLFPRYYYFKAWRRAYIFLLKQIAENFDNVQKNQPISTMIRGHFARMVKYTHLLPNKFPIFSILKINLLINELRIFSSVIDQKIIKVEQNELRTLSLDIELLIEAVVKKSTLSNIHEISNISLKKIALSWNYICSQT